jgi:hypothetical protein
MKNAPYEQVVNFDSPEAAKLTTVTGWMSREGRFYGNDERAARWGGCTHTACTNCGKFTPKHCLLCDDCKRAKEDAKWAARPRKEWDGKAMIFSETTDEYHNSPEDAEDCLEWNDGMTMEDLRLVICEPNYAGELTDEIFCDELDEDGNTPPELDAAIEVFNKAIKNIPPLSWSPGEFALQLEKKP